MITVVWFRQDLRVHDQPLLHRAAALGEPVVPLYVLPAHWTVPGPEGEDRLGAPKSAFLEECLADLSLSLEALGLALVTVVASPVTLGISANPYRWSRLKRMPRRKRRPLRRCGPGG